MALKVKICGVTRPEDARLAAELGAWAVGMVFAPSPRRLTVETAGRVREAVPRGVLAVGVFEGATQAEIAETIRLFRLDAVQVHGPWTGEDALSLPVPVIRVMAPGADPKAESELIAHAFALVEPARTLEDRTKGRRPSDGAQRTAWEFARELKRSGTATFVAGGLSPKNVQDAIALAGPDGVDVSGGVESSPGVKDPERLKAFFAAALAA